MDITDNSLKELSRQIKGDIYTDDVTRILYSTDASAYKEKPEAIIRPRDEQDIREIILFANKYKKSLIPRTAGTSLAGQVVGKGIIVDVSKYMTNILDLNVQEKWVKVQPGVVLDELNNYLKEYGLFFGPETSTSNRCMIGGMVGNNSCGAHSLIYGSTRDHTLEIKAVLSDGSIAEFKPISIDEYNSKCDQHSLEGNIYKKLREILSDENNQAEIKKEFPDKSLKRRNTGYALDLLLETEPFIKSPKKFNLSSLIAGSEGTLAFITEIKLNLINLPPKEKGLICIHFSELEKAFHGNLHALKFNPGAVELMDKVIMDCTKDSLKHKKSRFFIEGEPEALLLVEFARNTREEILDIASKMEEDMRKVGLGYHFPVLFGDEIKKVWDLRKAGLGLLSNVPGDAKPVAVIEDTAVNVEFLPDYMREFNDLLKQYGLNCVYYAHIGTGELHLRPVLNLKKEKDVSLFHTIALETAKLVKAYNGSLSGEHGDGRLRGEFIPLMVVNHNYDLFKQIKNTWDPNHIFNPNKIVDTPKMNTFLRYKPGQPTRDIDTVYDFSSTEGYLRMVEKCNGSADCRKSVEIGGVMCPSFMASKDENTTTRARANILREFITSSGKENPFDHKEIYNTLDLCLMCKGCKLECPSSVDMARLKSEFLNQWYKSHRPGLRARAIAEIAKLNKLMMIAPAIANFFLKNKLTSSIIKSILGFAKQRSIPLLYNTNSTK